METLDVGKLVNSVVFLSNLAHVGFKKIPNGVPLREYQKMKDGIVFICAELERLELQMSLISASELRSVIYEGAKEMGAGQSDPETAMWFMPLVFARYKNYADDLVTRLTDELSAKTFMVLSSENAGLFNGSKQPFSFKIQAIFSSLGHDMEGAGKCLALGRHTASVFHLMRIMETATQQLGTKLGVSSAQEKNWQTILDQVNKSLKGLSPGDPLKKKYAALSALLENVKLAWRNEVMHPKATYTEEEARAVFSAVQSFLNELASTI